MRSLSFRAVALTLTLTTGLIVVALWRNDHAFSFFKESRAVAEALLFPSSQSTNRAQRNEIEEEEYAVYAALINDNSREEKANHLLVIREQPVLWDGSIPDEKETFFADLKKSAPALMAETVDDLRARSTEQFVFTRRFNIKHRYVLISEQEINATFDKMGRGWEKFYRKYPGSEGFVTFSRVGFNRDRTQALVYQAYSCGGTCGGGTYYLLTKENGIWKVKGTIGPAWVS
jgi:hypothetical protein